MSAPIINAFKTVRKGEGVVSGPRTLKLNKLNLTAKLNSSLSYKLLANHGYPSFDSHIKKRKTIEF